MGINLFVRLSVQMSYTVAEEDLRISLKEDNPSLK